MSFVYTLCMLSQCSAAAALLRRNPNGHYLFGLDSGLCGSTRDERRDCISPVPYHVALGYYSVMKLSIVQKKRKNHKNKKTKKETGSMPSCFYFRYFYSFQIHCSCFSSSFVFVDSLTRYRNQHSTPTNFKKMQSPKFLQHKGHSCY